MKKLWQKSISILLTAVLAGGLLGKAQTTSIPSSYVVACVGDSITQGIGASSTAYNYPSQLQRALGERYDVRNCGVSGTTLLKEGDSPYTNQSLYQNSLNCNPNIVIIMLGTNDSKPQNWSYKDKYLSELVSLIHVYQNLSSKPTVYVATSPTVYVSLAGITDAVVTNAVVPYQKQAAQQTGCNVIDINLLTKEHSDWYSDGVHPNDGGYTQLSNAFADFLSKIYDPGIVAQFTTKLNALPQNPDASYASQVKSLVTIFNNFSSRQVALVTNQQKTKLTNAEASVKMTTTAATHPATTKASVTSTSHSTAPTVKPAPGGSATASSASSVKPAAGSSTTASSASSATSLDSAVSTQTDVTADAATSSVDESSTTAVSPASSTPKSSSFVPWLIGGIVLVAAAAGGVFVWLRRKKTVG